MLLGETVILAFGIDSSILSMNEMSEISGDCFNTDFTITKNDSEPIILGGLVPDLYPHFCKNALSVSPNSTFNLSKEEAKLIAYSVSPFDSS
jgi:hypothetical protein